MDAVERRRLARGRETFVGDINSRALSATANLGHCLLHLGKKHALERVRADRRLLIEPCGHGLRAVLAEELLCALRARQQAHAARLRLDNTAFPPGKLDAERLLESAQEAVVLRAVADEERVHP